MTVATASNVWDMTSTAGFQTIGVAIKAMWDAANPSIFAQTTDTGQVTVSTMTKPAVASTNAGYLNYKYTDSHGTYYIRFDLGVSTSITNFSITVTVGTGTNGAGTITGIILAAFPMFNGPATSILLSYPSECCVIDGCLHFILGGGATATAPTAFAYFAMSRFIDSTGAVDGSGLYIEANARGVTSHFATQNATSGSVTAWTIPDIFFPNSLTTTNIGSGGNNNYQQARVTSHITNEMKVVAFIGRSFGSEVAANTQLGTIGSPYNLAGSFSGIFIDAGTWASAAASNVHPVVLVYQ